MSLDGTILAPPPEPPLAPPAPARAGSTRYWSGAEEKVLRERYPSGGAEACAPHLPGRTIGAIQQHANTMHLRAPGNEFKRERWTSSEAIDNTIKRYWLKPYRGHGLDCARATMRPRWWVSVRARQLGLTAPRFKEPRWSEAELQIVADHAHEAPSTVQRRLAGAGYKRTQTAIIVKTKRQGWLREDPDHFTATGLAGLLGIDAKGVMRWIEKGWLKATRRGTDRVAAQGGDQHWIHRRDIRRFIGDNAAAIDLRKVADKEWFIDLLMDKGLEA